MNRKNAKRLVKALVNVTGCRVQPYKGSTGRLYWRVWGEGAGEFKTLQNAVS